MEYIISILAILLDSQVFVTLFVIGFTMLVMVLSWVPYVCSRSKWFLTFAIIFNIFWIYIGAAFIAQYMVYTTEFIGI